MPEAPASSQRPFDFADLGRPMPKSVRTLPPVPQADASGQLEEISGDDILESDDIDTLEAAAAGLSSFEVGDVGAFDEVEVEGITTRAIATRGTEPAAAPAAIGAVAVIAPVVKIAEPAMAVVASVAPAAAAPAVTATKVIPATLMGMPPAPATSPLPLDAREEDRLDAKAKEEKEKSVVVAEPAPVTARTPVVTQPSAAQAAAPAAAQPVVEKTLEIRGNDMSMVAAAAAKLGSEPDQTEVLVRSAMPAALQNVRGMQPDSGHARAGVPAHGRPSSVAPVALDVSRPLMPVIPPMARVPSVHVPARGARSSGGLSGAAIGGMAAAVILLVSLVGIGGYAASRTLSAKTDPVEATSSDTGEATTTAAASPAPTEAPAPATSSPIDVSSLPSAPVPGAAPRGFTGKGSFAVTPPPLPVAVPASTAPASPPAVAAAAAPAAPAPRSNGGALAAPGGRSAPAGAPLPPPASAPAVAAAPVAAAPAATTGVVHVDPNLRAVQVDGTFRRANDGTLVVACGTHRIKAGMKSTETVNVPCGGAVSL